jgi:hypothetical protein
MGGVADSVIASILTWAWDKQGVWSQGANKLKQSLFRARSASLALTILAAVLATLGVQIGEASSVAGRCLAAGAAVSVGLVALLQTATSRARIQAWTRVRSVSEALKSEIFVFLAGVAPYRGEDRAVRFRQNVQSVLADADDLSDSTIGFQPKHRSLPGVNDVASYIAERVQEQIDDYYRPKGAAMKWRAKQFRVGEIALSILALVLSATAAASGRQEFAAWSPVITTIIAAITAHTAVQRYDALALEYTRTYEQLERLMLDRLSSPSVTPQEAEKADDQFVSAAEGVISIQNESWMARNVAAAGTETGGGGAGANDAAPDRTP